MYFENLLALVLRKRLNIGEKLMAQLIKCFIKEKLNILYDEMKISPKPKIEVEIKESKNRLGYSQGNNHIEISSEVIENLCDGKISYINVVFHEMYHIKQFCQIEKEMWNNRVILYLKDSLLNEIENKANNSEESLYIKNNYNVESTEYYAYINGNMETIEFCEKHHIHLKRRELERLKEEKKILTPIRYVGGNKKFNREYMDVHEAFDYILSTNEEIYKEVKKEYPILLKERGKKNEKYK